MRKEELEKELERKQRLIKKALTILGEPNGKTKEVVVAGSRRGWIGKDHQNLDRAGNAGKFIIAKLFETKGQSEDELTKKDIQFLQSDTRKDFRASR